jgi:hypothetical protein
LRADQDISGGLIARLLVKGVDERGGGNKDDGKKDDPLPAPEDAQPMLKAVPL